MRFIIAAIAAVSAYQIRPINEVLLETRFADEINADADYDDITKLTQQEAWEHAKNAPV